MKIPEVKRLVESHGQDELNHAAEALENEQEPAMEVNGDDQGERLTHVLSAVEVINQSEKNDISLRESLRNFTRRVRDVNG